MPLLDALRNAARPTLPYVWASIARTSRRNNRLTHQAAAIFDRVDFSLQGSSRRGFRLSFSSRFGYQRAGYEPSFRFNWPNRWWEVSVDSQAFCVRQNPCFELINELRGYSLVARPSSGDVVLDVGAGTGLFTCWASVMVGKDGRVVSLEPDEVARRMVLQNIEASSLGNVSCLPLGLSNRTGNGYMALSAVGSSTLHRTPGPGRVRIQTSSLQDLVSRLGLPEGRISLMKLDVEGFEYDIATTLVDFIARNPQTVACIASYHRRCGEPTANALERVVSERSGVMAKTVFPYHQTTYLVNRANERAAFVLGQLPSYDEVRASIWS